MQKGQQTEIRNEIIRIINGMDLPDLQKLNAFISGMENENAQKYESEEQNNGK